MKTRDKLIIGNQFTSSVTMTLLLMGSLMLIFALQTTLWAETVYSVCEEKCEEQRAKQANLDRLREAFPYAKSCDYKNCYN